MLSICWFYHTPEPPSQSALTSVVLVQLENDALDPLHVLLCPLHLTLHHWPSNIVGVAGCKGGLEGRQTKIQIKSGIVICNISSIYSRSMPSQHVNTYVGLLHVCMQRLLV